MPPQTIIFAHGLAVVITRHYCVDVFVMTKDKIFQQICAKSGKTKRKIHSVHEYVLTDVRVVGRDIAIGAKGLGFDSQVDLFGRSVFNDSLALQSF